jgi:hypothetical protein
MRNNRGKAAFTLAAVLLSFALGFLGCPLEPDTSFTLAPDGLLPVDANGHFQADISYTVPSSTSYDNGTVVFTGKTIDTFNKDGAFEHVFLAYEAAGADIDGDGTAGEGYIRVFGTRGTYSYSPQALLLTRTYAESISAYNGIWNATTQKYDYTWVADPQWYAVNYTNAYNAFMIKRKWGSAFVGSAATPDQWVCTSVTSYPDGFSYSSTTSYTITDATVAYAYATSSASANGAATTTYESRSTLDIHNAFPADTLFEEGASMTFYGYYSEARYRQWDSAAAALGAWTDTYNKNRTGSYTFTHQGGFIVETFSLDDFSRDIPREGL